MKTTAQLLLQFLKYKLGHEPTRDEITKALNGIGLIALEMEMKNFEIQQIKLNQKEDYIKRQSH